ncbi:MAG: YggS family pyridoxal phosphate-dependent enzyme [Aeromonas sp.]
MNPIAQSLQQVATQIHAATQAAARDPAKIALLAVSKTKPLHAIMDAYAAGQRCFGESYAQEAVAKITTLREQGGYGEIEWHFIGPLQSNKSKLVAEHFAWVQSVDSSKLIARLARQRPAHLPPLNICLQVNISHEASKSGADASEVLALAAEVAAAPNLHLRGLMAIPAHSDDIATLNAQMAAMQALYQRLAAAYSSVDTLSMGMSDDLAPAIAHGSTLVRVGSAIFGARDYSTPNPTAP